MRTLEKEATFALESLKKLVSSVESTTVEKSISENRGEGLVPSYSVSIWSIENCKQVVKKHIAGSGFDTDTPKTLLL